MQDGRLVYDDTATDEIAEALAKAVDEPVRKKVVRRPLALPPSHRGLTREAQQVWHELNGVYGDMRLLASRGEMVTPAELHSLAVSTESVLKSLELAVREQGKR